MKKNLFGSLFAISMIATALVLSCSKKDDPIAVTGVQLSDNEIVIMGGGDTATLTATILPENADNKAVTWTSSAPEIASVNENGVVTALAEEGTATIIVITQDGNKTATCQVKVTPKANIAPCATHYIKMVTQMPTTEKLRLEIRVADEADKADVWIDLNNNGTKDTGENDISFLPTSKQYTFQSQTITIYGKIIGFDCDYNDLILLDVSNNTELDRLMCYNSSLTQLDVSKNTNLTRLSCRYNKLTQLDISKNTKLNWLDCSKNQFSEEEISKLINDLPDRKGKDTGSFFLIDNHKGTDGNYQPVTEGQKQKVREKNWNLRVRDASGNWSTINP